MQFARRALLGVFLVATVSLVNIFPAAAAPDGIVRLVSVPGLSNNWSFDITWVDSPSHRAFIADRDNKGITIIDTNNARYLGTIKGFAGPLPNNTGGPNGVVAAPDLNEVWAGDGDSTLKVVDLGTQAITHSIPTGGVKRADELAYDPEHRIILVANDADNPPFLTFVNAQTFAVLGHIPLPQATNGVEQPQYDTGLHKFFQAIPATVANPGGELDRIDPLTMQIEATYGLQNCGPNGLAIGPSETALLGCNHSAPGTQINSQIISLTTGTVLRTITQTGAPDEVWYNPGDHRYYLGATGWTSTGLVGGPNTPVLGIIDALTGTFVANIPTGTNRAASVAVDSSNNFVVLPHRADLGQPAEVRIYAPMGGEAFSLTAKGPTSSGEALLTWSPATVQPRYELSRLTPSGVTTLQISGGSTSAFVDGIPVGTPWACYQLASIDALGATAAKSDELCELPGTGFGTPPDQFTIQLNQSPTASLSWKSVAGASNILVVPLGTSRLQVLPGSATSTQDATGGSLTCYGLADLQGASLAGVAPILCAIPGQSQ
ncbi:MAG TPA: hypothetical protein VFC51_03615 [Chloroflexota bacterium]|nr:hypothetical protein [Chloroflexota bacterium]